MHICICIAGFSPSGSPGKASAPVHGHDREWTGLLPVPGRHQWHLGAGRRPMSGVDVDPGPRLACGLCYCSVDWPDEGKLVWEWWEWYSLARKRKKGICSPYLLHFNLTTLIADGIDQPAVSWLVLFVNGRFATKSNPTVHIDDVCDTCAVQFSNPYYCCHILASIEKTGT